MRPNKARKSTFFFMYISAFSGDIDNMCDIKAVHNDFLRGLNILFFKIKPFPTWLKVPRNNRFE